MGADADMLALVNSANIACGFHAGDPLVIQRTLAAALHHGVEVGAHPSYPDLQGFGRRAMHLSTEELQAVITYQVAALQGMARSQGGKLRYVKPHGALSNMACADGALAGTVASSIHTLDAQLMVLAPACSALSLAGEAAGLRVANEIFADRAYQDDGQLVPRSQANAMVHGPQASWQHVQTMLRAGGIVSVNGVHLPCRIDSICVHGDNAQAVETAQYLRQQLQLAGFNLSSLEACLAAN